MKDRTHPAVALLMAVTLCHGAMGAGRQEEAAMQTLDAAVKVGDDRQLFVDALVIERLKRVRRRMHEPLPREVVLRLDKPWEGKSSWCPVVIQEKGRFRMWYRADDADGRGADERSMTCYAESDDGVHWERPHLGLYAFRGSTENNICFKEPLVRNVGVFRDERPGVPEAERYKAVARGNDKGRRLIYALASADGIRWGFLSKEPILVGKGRDNAFDNPPIAFWDVRRKRYAIYVRGWRPPNAKRPIRAIRMSTSDDFIHWTPLRYITINGATRWRRHLYTTSAHLYYRAPLVLMFPKRFLPGRKFFADWPHKGLSDVLLMASRDGLNFSQPFQDAFLRPGLDSKNWHDRAICVAPAVVRTAEGEMSLYCVQNYRTESVHVRRFTLREDGFVSAYAPSSGGVLLTKPLVFRGSRLEINYSTSAAGAISVEIQDSAGAVLAGFSARECGQIFGDEISRTVRWKGGDDLSRLAGRAVRLRFAMREADLYSFRFRAR